MIWWLGGGSGWGTREQAIPGEWAMLLLVIALAALLGLVVLWFTLLRHERAVRRRERRRAGTMLLDVGSAAAEPVPTRAAPEADQQAGADVSDGHMSSK